nr:asparagine synthase-related protein [Caulobacter sp. RHG1]
MIVARDQFVALAWLNGEVSGAGTTAIVRVKADLEREGWRLAYERPGLWVFGFGDSAARVVPWGTRGGVVIGDVFNADGDLVDGIAELAGDVDLATASRHLSDQYWGRYVALFPAVQRDVWGVYRDPMGGIDAFGLRYADVVVVASSLPHAVLRHFTDGVAIDWVMVRRVVTAPNMAQTCSLLLGVEAIEPGELIAFEQSGPQRRRIWAPGEVARRPPPSGDLEGKLRQTVDRCVGAWAAAYGPVIAEVSGGLDSSIVAAALVSQGADVKSWLNHFIDDWVGDERPYARALTERLGVELTEVPRAELVVRPTSFLDVADGPRPTFNAADIGFDEAMGSAARAAGASAIMTGQGGDVVFFQMETPTVAADRFRRLGFKGLSWAFLREIAVWNQVSVWTVLRQVFGHAQSAKASSHTLTSAHDRLSGSAVARHTWIEMADGLPPAKRLQIANLAYIQLVRGRSRRGREAAVLHPLLSQPVVELCLSIPADRLVQGGRSRGLARDTFAERLPGVVANRRTKGDMTAFYGHALAAGLDEITPFLLDGRLVAAGILDRDLLEIRLSLEELAHVGRYGEIYGLLAIEAWVRSWEERLARLSPPELAVGPISGVRKEKTSDQ